MPRTIAESIYQRLRQDILWDRFAPGSPLRSDVLRARYDVGISPLREALTRLASERLVTSVGQRGFRVAPLTAYDVEDTLIIRLVIEKGRAHPLHRKRRYCLGNRGSRLLPRAITQSHSERARSGDRRLRDLPSAIPHIAPSPRAKKSIRSIMASCRSAMPPGWRRRSRARRASIKTSSPTTCTATNSRPWPVISSSARTESGRRGAHAIPEPGAERFRAVRQWQEAASACPPECKTGDIIYPYADAKK